MIPYNIVSPKKWQKEKNAINLQKYFVRTKHILSEAFYRNLKFESVSRKGCDLFLLMSCVVRRHLVSLSHVKHGFLFPFEEFRSITFLF